MTYCVFLLGTYSEPFIARIVERKDILSNAIILVVLRVAAADLSKVFCDLHGLICGDLLT
jgi:hypothetical protein